jgi:hypothetical protein
VALAMIAMLLTSAKGRTTSANHAAGAVDRVGARSDYGHRLFIGIGKRACFALHTESHGGTDQPCAGGQRMKRVSALGGSSR